MKTHQQLLREAFAAMVVTRDAETRILNAMRLAAEQAFNTSRMYTLKPIHTGGTFLDYAYSTFEIYYCSVEPNGDYLKKVEP
jgi:hypothetical protein